MVAYSVGLSEELSSAYTRYPTTYKNAFGLHALSIVGTGADDSALVNYYQYGCAAAYFFCSG